MDELEIPRPLADRGRNTPVDGLGKSSAWVLPLKEANPARTGTRSAGGRNRCVCNFANRLWDTEHLSHSPFSGLEREEELGMLAMLEWSLLAVTEDFFRVVPNGSEIQSL